MHHGAWKFYANGDICGDFLSPLPYEIFEHGHASMLTMQWESSYE